MKKFILVLVLFCNCKSQNNYEDVVYLKNGSIIHGIIIEQVPGVSLKIKNHYNDVFFYKIDEVEKITKEEPVSPKSEPTKSKEVVKTKKNTKVKRVWEFDSLKIRTNGIIEIGGLFGIAWSSQIRSVNSTGTNQSTTIHHESKIGWTTNMFNLKIAVDKMLNRRLSIGGGLGIDISKTDPISGVSPSVATFLQAFMDIRYTFLRKRISPFISGQAGATFFHESDYLYEVKGVNAVGALAAIQIGIKVFTSPKVALSMAVGYRFQHVYYSHSSTFSDEFGNNISTSKSNFNIFLHYLSLNWGVAF
jgi:hypothetical protein